MKSLFLVLCAALAVSASAKTTFRYGSKAGDALKYRMVSTSEMNTSQMGQEQTINMKTDGMLAVNVESATNDAFTYTSAFDLLKMKVAMGERMDTTLEVKDLIGRRTRHEATLMGHEISSMVIDTVKWSDPMIQQFASQVKGMARIFMELPENGMSTGDTWTVARKDTQQSDGGAIMSDTKINATYLRECDTLGHKCAVFGYTVTVGIEGKMKIQKMFDAAVTGDGSGKGNVYFDAAAGKLIANINTMEMNQSVAITGQMSMVIPSTITSNTSMVLQ